MDNLADNDEAQKTLGMWSQIMAAIQTVILLITLGLVHRGAPWEVYAIFRSRFTSSALLSSSFSQATRRTK